MKSILQRVTQASVTVENQVVGEIGPGLLVLFGVEKGDDQTKLDYHFGKILRLRIFSDDHGKMNRSVQAVGGGVLLVSQFTLAGDCSQGNRPGFDRAMPPAEAQRLYEMLIRRLQETGLAVATGVFGAQMQVSLINDGPVTFLLEN